MFDEDVRNGDHLTEKGQNSICNDLIGYQHSDEECGKFEAKFLFAIPTVETIKALYGTHTSDDAMSETTTKSDIDSSSNQMESAQGTEEKLSIPEKAFAILYCTIIIFSIIILICSILFKTYELTIMTLLILLTLLGP